MDDIEAVFNRKDMTFEEAVQYFKERVPVTASVFYSMWPSNITLLKKKRR